MNPIEHPGTIMLIHNEKVRQEMERELRGPWRGERPRPRGGNGPRRRMRLALSHGLIALARRIAPAETGDSGLPAGTPH